VKVNIFHIQAQRDIFDGLKSGGKSYAEMHRFN